MLPPMHLVFLITSFAVISIGIYVLVKKPKNFISSAFFASTLGITIWSVGFVLLSFTGNFFFNRIILFGGLVLVTGIFAFGNVFPKEVLPRRLFLASFIPALLGLLLIVPEHLVIESTTVFEDGHLEPNNGPLFPVFALILLFYMLSSIVLIVKNYISSAGRTRRQMRYVILGFSFFLCVTLVSDVILPAIGIFKFNTLGPLSSVVLFGTTAYAIVRHQLLDIRVVIQRSMVYALLAGSILGLYVALLLFLQYFLALHANIAPVISAGIATLFGITTGSTLEAFFRRKTDFLFFQDPYEFPDAITSATRAIVEQSNIPQFAKNMQRSVDEALRPENIHFIDFQNAMVIDMAGTSVPIEKKYNHAMRTFIRDQRHIINVTGLPKSIRTTLPEEFSSDNCLRVVAPLSIKDEVIAALCLGAKKSGDAYNTTDILLLEAITYHAATALENIHLHEQEREHARNLEKIVEQRTGELRTLQEQQKQSMLDISHGLQTPLTILRGRVELLPAKPTKKTIKELAENVDEVSNLAYELTALARLNTTIPNKQHMQEASLSNILSELLEHLVSVAKKEGVKLTHDIQDKVAVRGIHDDLRHLCMNIIGNAIKCRKTS